MADWRNASGWLHPVAHVEGRPSRPVAMRPDDPEWAYVDVRRLGAYVEHSIDHGLQWVVFEPNTEATWSQVRRQVEDFLLSLWQQGRLTGNRPEEAFFVKADRSTMTQEDVDNGRLVVLVGIAPLRPSEFVIIRVGQWALGGEDDRDD